LAGIRYTKAFQKQFARAQKALAQIVREHRHELGLSRKQLAEKAKFSVSTLIQIEQGRGNPSLTRMVNLAKAMGMKPSRLFGLIHEESR
jgi:transcriptional regulator with XRE-family HTH domain